MVATQMPDGTLFFSETDQEGADTFQGWDAE